MSAPCIGFERRQQRRGMPDGEPPRAELTALIIGMFRELPGLRLHLGQAARLFGLRVKTCHVVLDDLVRAGDLQRAADGQYAGPTARLDPVTCVEPSPERTLEVLSDCSPSVR